MNSRRDFVKAIGLCALSPSVALASGGAAKPAESNFIAASQITGTIMAGLRPIGIMQVDVGVYTTDQSLKLKLPQLRPVLVSSWRAGLQEYINKYYTLGQVPDANILANLLQKAVQPVFGSAPARVLIQAIIAR